MPRRLRLLFATLPKARRLTMSSTPRAHCYPYLFSLITLCAIAELGLTAFLISAGNEKKTWASPRYYSLLIMFLFNAAWTTVFSIAYMMWFADGTAYLLASIASSIIWLLTSTTLWGTAATIMHNTRRGGNCSGRPSIHRCRQSLAVEALGWTEFSLCAITLAATCLWVGTGKRAYVSDSQRLV